MQLVTWRDGARPATSVRRRHRRRAADLASAVTEDPCDVSIVDADASSRCVAVAGVPASPRADRRVTTRRTPRGTRSTAVAEGVSCSTRRQAAARSKLRDMARRLSAFTDLQRSTRCRIRRGGGRTAPERASCSPSRINDALNYGDPAGAAYRRREPIPAPAGASSLRCERLTPGAPRRWSRARDARPRGCSTTIAGPTRHRPAALQRPQAGAAGDRRARSARSSTRRDEQSTTAVLDKISGAGADRRPAAAGPHPAARRRSSSSSLVDTKRARDTEAAAMNMQLVTWRDGRPRTTAFVAGTGDALRTWRQP